MKKVMVVVITKDKVMPECWDSILNQDYDNFDTMIHIQKPRVCLEDIANEAHICCSDLSNKFEPFDHDTMISFKFSDEMKRIILKYHNCSENREVSRQLALASDAYHFIFVDSDIKLPLNTISTFIESRKEVIGGWYKIQNSERYPIGQWLGNNIYKPYYSVQEGLIVADQIGLGCAMFSRYVLEKLRFEHGTDKWARIFLNKGPANFILGECGALGQQMIEEKITSYVTGKIVCEHLI